jgi:hypothetical protein
VFSDHFDRGLSAWRVHGDGVSVRDSKDPARGMVLELVPRGDMFALIKGSGAPRRSSQKSSSPAAPRLARRWPQTVEASF